MSLQIHCQIQMQLVEILMRLILNFSDVLQVIMRLIQSAVTEVKAIQLSASQDLLAMLPTGEHPSIPEFDAEFGGQGGSALLPGQEKLHQEGKAALRTLSSTRELLQEAMERELQEQRELRAQCRAFFRSVVPSTAFNIDCCS